MSKRPKIKDELHKLLKPIVEQHEALRQVPPPQFFLHAGDGSTGFADLEAAKAFGRKFPSSAYIADTKGQVIWEKTKNGMEHELTLRPPL